MSAFQFQIPGEWDPDQFALFQRELESILAQMVRRGETAPTPTAFSGTFTSVAATVQYMQIADRCFHTTTVTITTNGTADGYISVPMPVKAARLTGQNGTDATGFVALCGYVTGSNLLIKKYDNTYPGADGKTLVMSGSYQTARL